MTKPINEPRENYHPPGLPKPVYNTSARDRAQIDQILSLANSIRNASKEPSNDHNPNASSGTAPAA